jgi:phosphoribosyl 1,2-cyclic phosphodiesterase
MQVRFWGVRGSIPVPGPSTIRYGGNTPCVSIELESDKVIALDAGTGIRKLGKALVSEDKVIYVSHIHWDHIQGLPFFAPLYEPDQTIYLLSHQVGSLFSCLIEQMDGLHFPVTRESLPSRLHHIKQNAMVFLREHGINISRIATNHPGRGGYGYRIEARGGSVVYLTDNELDPPQESQRTGFDGFVRFCRNADVLVHDAQFLQDDMPQKRGWGHSLVRQACGLAIAAEVKHLVLFHHDPNRTDDELDRIQETARSWVKRKNPRIQCTAAFEGLTLNIKGREETVNVNAGKEKRRVFSDWSERTAQP